MGIVFRSADCGKVGMARELVMAIGVGVEALTTMGANETGDGGSDEDSNRAGMGANGNGGDDRAGHVGNDEDGNRAGIGH